MSPLVPSHQRHLFLSLVFAIGAHKPAQIGDLAGNRALFQKAGGQLGPLAAQTCHGLSLLLLTRDPIPSPYCCPSRQPFAACCQSIFHQLSKVKWLGAKSGVSNWCRAKAGCCGRRSEKIQPTAAGLGL